MSIESLTERGFYEILVELWTLTGLIKMIQDTETENKKSNFSDNARMMFSDKPVSTDMIKPKKPDGIIIAAAVISVVWALLVFHYALASGWWAMRFEMTPSEFTGFVSGFLSPFAFIWIAAVYFSSQRKYVKEAESLREYISEFTHPSSKNKLYVKSLLDDIRQQTKDLNTVYGLLKECTERAQAALSTRRDDLSQTVRNLEEAVNSSVLKIEHQTDLLNESAQSVSRQTVQDAELLKTNLNAVQSATDHFTDTFATINGSLQNNIQVLKNTGDALADNSASISAEIREQQALLQNSTENARDILTRQTTATTAELNRQTAFIVEAGNRIFDTVNQQTAQIREAVEQHISALVKTEENIEKNLTSVLDGIESKIDSLNNTSETALTTAANMLSGLEKRTNALNEIYAAQTTAIADNDEKLKQTSDQIQSTFKEQNTVLDQEVEKIISRFRTIETTLDTYVNEINAVSSIAVEQISSVSDSLNGKAEKIVEIGEQTRSEVVSINDELDNKTNAMSDIIAALKTTSEDVSNAVISHTRILSGALDNTDSQLTRIKENLLSGISEFSDSISSTEDKAETAGLKMSKRTSELSDLTGALVSQAIVTETSLAQQQKYVSAASAKLEEAKISLKEQATDLTNIADLLDNRAAETVLRLTRLFEDTLTQAGRLNDQVGDLNNSLLDKINALDLSSQKTVIANKTLKEELERHKIVLDATADRMTSYTEEMCAEISRQATQMDISAELIQSRSEKAVSQIDEQFKRLTEDVQVLITNTQNAASLLTGQAESLESLFGKQSVTLSEVSGKLLEQSSAATTMLREQSEQADKDLERLASRIRLIDEELGVQKKELVDTSEMTISQLGTVGSALTRQTENLAFICDNAQSKITEINADITETCQKISETTQTAHQRNTEALSALGTKQNEFKQAADELLQRVIALHNEIGEQTDNLQKQSAKSTQQAVTIRDSMMRHIMDLGDTANIVATQSRMGEAALANQINYLKEAAENVMSHIRNINDAVRQNTNDLLAASSRIGFELDAMGENLRRRNEEAAKSTEDSLIRAQNAAQFMEEKASRLSSVTEEAINNLTAAGNEFSANADRVSSAGEVAREQIETTGETFLVQSHQLTRISEDAQKAVKNFSVVMRERATDFNKTADEAGNKVKNMSSTISQIGKEFEEMSNKSVIQIDLAGQRLRSMISEVAGNSERIAVEVRKSGEQFVDQSDLLSVAADEALKRLQNLLSVMQENSKEIQDSGEKISAQSLKLGGAFNRQVQSLITASKSAEEYIAALDKKKQEADTDRFMLEASFILERLQSLGVDMARIYTPNVEEDLWKRYYSGDRSAFIRHLSRAIDKHQVRKITELFTENSEFREYVSRYISEFDGVLSRAQENERSDVLTGILLGSESGRLYMLLSRVFNKEA